MLVWYAHPINKSSECPSCGCMSLHSHSTDRAHFNLMANNKFRSNSILICAADTSISFHLYYEMRNTTQFAVISERIICPFANGSISRHRKGRNDIANDENRRLNAAATTTRTRTVDKIIWTYTNELYSIAHAIISHSLDIFVTKWSEIAERHSCM